MRAIRVHEQGEPDVMVLEEVERPTPGEGQALVGLEAIGVNMIDVQQRSGAYPIGLPFTPGTEGAGLVLEVVRARARRRRRRRAPSPMRRGRRARRRSRPDRPRARVQLLRCPA